MMLFAAAAVASMVVVGAAHAAPADSVEVASRAKQSLVTVSWIDARRPQNAYVRVGVVVRKDGMVLVAGPVSDARGRYVIRMPSGSIGRADFVAADPRTALTLVQMPGKTLTPLSAFTAPTAGTAAKPGDRVMLVSASGAIARGALRAQHRYDRIAGAARTVLRTTGLYEAGLSALASDRGAPWFAADGSFVGLHYGRTVGIDPKFRARAHGAGLRVRSEVTASYAVPANAVRIVWPLLAAQRRVPRGALGVRTKVLDDAMRAQVCPGCGGHVVIGVEADGPAARAGLRTHDLILSVAGVPVAIGASLHDALLPHRPGAVVALEILRAGARKTVSVTLVERGE